MEGDPDLPMTGGGKGHSDPEVGAVAVAAARTEEARREEAPARVDRRRNEADRAVRAARRLAARERRTAAPPLR